MKDASHLQLRMKHLRFHTLQMRWAVSSLRCARQCVGPRWDAPTLLIPNWWCPSCPMVTNMQDKPAHSPERKFSSSPPTSLPPFLASPHCRSARSDVGRHAGCPHVLFGLYLQQQQHSVHYGHLDPRQTALLRAGASHRWQVWTQTTKMVTRC